MPHFRRPIRQSGHSVPASLSSQPPRRAGAGNRRQHRETPIRQDLGPEARTDADPTSPGHRPDEARDIR